jgi:two-component system chemotaxis response regulator CheB
MRAAGSRTVAQDEATSVVWGMPGEAVSIGAAEEVVSIDDMARHLRNLAEGMDFTKQAGAL